MPCFHSTSRGMTGHSAQPESLGFDRLPDVDVGVADHQRVRARRRAPDLRGDAGLLRAGHQVVDEHAEPAIRAGRRSRRRCRADRRHRPGIRRRRPRCAGRHPRPVRRVRRRAGPPRRSGRPVPSGPAHPARPPNPEAVRVGDPRAGCSGGAVRITGRPSSRKPGPSGNPLVRPCRSSRSTRPYSTRTTAPTHPLCASSTTRPGFAANSVDRGLRSPWGFRASTSGP